MSQWTLVKTRMNDLNGIKNALNELGCTYEEFQTAKPFKDTYMNKKVDLLLKRGKHIDCNVGFSKTSSGDYEMLIAEYASEASKSFLNKIRKTYMTQKIMKQMQDMECAIASQNVEADGKIRMVAVVA